MACPRGKTKVNKSVYLNIFKLFFLVYKYITTIPAIIAPCMANPPCHNFTISNGLLKKYVRL